MTVATSYFSTIRRNSFLVAYYRMNENSGTRASDYAARYGLNGIYDGTVKPYGHGPLILNDELARSAKFGSTGQNIEVPDAAPLRIIENISIEAWVLPIEVNQNSTFISKMNSAATFAAPYYFGLSSGKIIFTLGNGINSTSIISTSTIAIGSPSHILVTNFRKNLYIFINGKQENTQSLVSQEIKDEKQPMFVGALSNNTKRFNGYMSELAIYNGSIPFNLIENHFNIGRQVNTNPYYITTFDRPSFS